MPVAIIAVFVAGYVLIALEHRVRINKAATALFIGVICWTLYLLDVHALLHSSAIPEWFVTESQHEGVADIQQHFAIEHQLLRLTGEIASILFFLMGAMTIVEVVDQHEGFVPITDRIRTRSKRKLMWTIGPLAFFMSAVLDNLTTTIVIVTLLRKIITHREDRLRFVGLVVIAANAGGAWTVIGDVTTTMLWIKHKISTVAVMQELLLGSLVCLVVPMLILSWMLEGDIERPVPSAGGHKENGIQRWHQWLFLIAGICGLISVPIFKGLTHLPPYMGMMLSLSLLWLLTELIEPTLGERDASSTGVLAALRRVDMATILFFLGILLAVGALAACGTLRSAATWLDQELPNRDVVAVAIGFISAVVDNVPIVAAAIEMYDLPMNDDFWMLLAYCAGTGGSCLIIGSAAGVAAMGLDHIDFLWYLKRMTPLAVIGYLAGAAVVILQLSLF